MSVRWHRVLFWVLAVVLLIALVPLLMAFPVWTGSILAENVLEGVIGEPLIHWVSGIAPYVGAALGLVVVVKLFEFLLTKVYPAFVPARCARPGCRSQMQIVKGPGSNIYKGSYVYICKACGAEFESGLSYGGDN